MDTVPLPKHANHYRLIFDSFGNGNHERLTQQVARITRPHLLRYDAYEAANTAPIDIDLRDDLADLARTEVLTQILRQTKDDATFDLVLEVFDRYRTTIECWRLLQCRIVDCQFDELNYENTDRLLIHLSVVPKRIEVSMGDSFIELFG